MSAKRRQGNVAARPVFAAAKLPLQKEKVALQIGKERGRARLLALAFNCPVRGAMQRLEVADPHE